MMSRVDIKARAWQVVKQIYWPIVGAYVLVMLIELACSVLSIFSVFITNIVMVGASGYFLYRFRGQPANINVLFWPFQRYGRVLGGTLWKILWIFLWSLLFVVPGIVKAYSYFCTEYILADSPNVEATRALELSKRMMHGNKAKIFVMHLSFIGWALLGVAALLALYIPSTMMFSLAAATPYAAYSANMFSINIFTIMGAGGALSVLGYLIFYAYLCLFLGPYVATTSAGFYEEIKRDAINRGVVAWQEFEYPMQQPQYGQPQQPYEQQQPQYGQQQQPPYGQPPIQDQPMTQDDKPEQDK